LCFWFAKLLDFATKRNRETQLHKPPPSKCSPLSTPNVRNRFALFFERLCPLSRSTVVLVNHVSCSRPLLNKTNPRTHHDSRRGHTRRREEKEREREREPRRERTKAGQRSRERVLLKPACWPHRPLLWLILERGQSCHGLRGCVVVALLGAAVHLGCLRQSTCGLLCCAWGLPGLLRVVGGLRRLLGF
jgi:hypothetical protein